MDETAFDAFYAESYDRLVGQLHALTGSLPEAQDCVQEAFIRAWDHRRELGAVANPEAWVRTVARRLSVSRWRKHRRQLPLTVDVAHQHQLGPDAVALQRAMGQISADQRHAIVLHDLVGLSVAEIAAEVGVAEGTVKARLSRGRRTLATLLDDRM